MAIVNITTQSDADFIRSFFYQYTSTGDGVDLTGAKMKMGIRKRPEDVTELLMLTTENGGIQIVNPSIGNFIIWITHDQLERLRPDTYVHSLIRIPAGPANLHLRVWSGNLTHNAGPSR